MENKSYSYCIHAFMHRELGLGGSELLIYAIIYSFSIGGKGVFYGSVDYLAEASGVSYSTARRALARLVEGRLIEKCSLESGASVRDGYRVPPCFVPDTEVTVEADGVPTCNESVVGEVDEAQTCNEMGEADKVPSCTNTVFEWVFGEPTSDEPSDLTDCDTECDEPSDLAHCDTECDEPSDLTDCDTECDEPSEPAYVNELEDTPPCECPEYDVAHPKYKLVCVGNEDLICMTAEQYKKLVELIGREDLHCYIRRLELLILEHGYRTFNPYKTLKKWICDDCSL